MLLGMRYLGCVLVTCVGLPVVAYAQPQQVLDEPSTIKLMYFVPEGFSQSDMDASLQLLVTINGEPMPAPIKWSGDKNQFVFDEDVYRQNNISEDVVTTLGQILKKINYSECGVGCDLDLDGWKVTINKTNQTFTLVDGKLRFLRPKTDYGFVHNQNLEFRDSENGNRSFFAQGDGYIGLPNQAYGYFHWYHNNNHSKNISTNNTELTTAFLQKNFDQFYVRGGRHDSLDYNSSSVSTSINQSFKEFVTVASQSNLDSTRDDSEKLSFFSNSDGVFELWTNGRRIFSQVASIGLNKIEMSRLPGGFYTVEVRLVDSNGQVLNTETRQIANVAYGKKSGWFVTAGRALDRDKGELLNGGFSYSNDFLYGTSALLYSTENLSVFETNASHPMKFKEFDISPTVGFLAGEKGTSGYFRFGLANQTYGNFNISHFSGNEVSSLYYGSGSTSVNVTRSFGKVLGSYFYNKFQETTSQQLQVTWSSRLAGVLAQYNIGLQKGGYSYRDQNEVGVFANATFYFDRNTNGSINVAYQDSSLNSSASYYKNFKDSLGATTLGVDLSKRDSDDLGFNAYAKRLGTRGEIVGRLGHSDGQNNYSINYNSMFAASKDGYAFGRVSSQGSAMLVETPNLGDDVDYSFWVDEVPVASGSKYAIPIGSYRDISYAGVQSIDKNLDMNIRLPANIVRSHPGQVYPVKADVDVTMLYSGFLEDSQGAPVSGVIHLSNIQETAYPNGLFSIASKKVLTDIKVETAKGNFNCDLRHESSSHRYLCKPE